MSVSASERRSRGAYDWSVIAKMRSRILRIMPVASIDDAEAGVALPTREAGEGRASLFHVRYLFPMLSTAYAPLDEAVVLFDLDAGGDYPFSKPSAQVLSTPRPLSPHVHPISGSICLGETWAESRGQMLFAQLLVHVAKLLNLDERDPGASFDGFNADAIRYWRRTLGSRPLNPALVYPALPEDVAFGIETKPVLVRRCLSRVEVPVLARRAS